MEVIKTEIDGVLIIKINSFKDDRGYFSETYSLSRYKQFGITENFVQDNISVSKKGTLRGLHYQIPPKAQAKLCQVIKGRVLDVVVDLRFGSPTFGKYFSIELLEGDHTQIYIPIGFAHGFAALTDDTVFSYKCSEYYSKDHERGIRFDDNELKIDWTIENPLVSPKDRAAKYFREIEKDFYYHR